MSSLSWLLQPQRGYSSYPHFTLWWWRVASGQAVIILELMASGWPIRHSFKQVQSEPRLIPRWLLSKTLRELQRPSLRCSSAPWQGLQAKLSPSGYQTAACGWGWMREENFVLKSTQSPKAGIAEADELDTKPMGRERLTAITSIVAIKEKEPPG